MNTGYHGLDEIEHAFYEDVAGVPGRKITELPTNGDVWVGMLLNEPHPFVHKIPVEWVARGVQFYISVPG